jgi:hypothetical protein
VRREDFDALVAAVAATAEVNEVIVVGSQAILASIDEKLLPRQVTLSPEIDVVIAAHPRAGAIRRLLGPGSLSDSQRGVYVDVVSEHTPRLAANWRARAIRRQSPDMPLVSALCPDIHDLALAKLGAGRRDKDFPYVEALLAATPPLLDLDVLEERLPEMNGVISMEAIDRIRVWLSNARKRWAR